MPDEPLVPSAMPSALAMAGDYDAICAALMRTERGRWFLDEFARRNRHADTETLLGAIRRIEAVVRSNNAQQARQELRSDLLEMAKAITHTRAEVAAAPDGTAPATPEPSRPADVFAAAARIRDVTWAMRGHGFDPAVCSQIEELAASILSAASLRDPGDRRVRKLSDVLQYLEHRIEVLLDSLGTAPRTSESDGTETAASRPPERGAIADALQSAPPPSRPGRILLRPLAPRSDPPVAPRQQAPPLMARPEDPPGRPPAAPDTESTAAVPIAEDPLAALDAMSEEERLALFT